MSEASQVTVPTLKAINALPHAKAIKIHGSVYMEVGTPDLLAVVEGIAYLLEAKLPGKKPTQIQRKRLREWEAAGTVVGIICNAGEAAAIIAGDPAMRAAARARVDETPSA